MTQRKLLLMVHRAKYCCLVVALASAATATTADVLLIKVITTLTARISCWPLLSSLPRMPHALVHRCAVQGGTVVNADQQFRADVLIKDGLIDAVAPSLKVL